VTVDSDKQGRLEALRKALESGTYQIDPKVVVDAIIVRALKRLPQSDPRA
jgi:anti-sigma28 factor (negative regulator of flagellin synthesis)